MINECMLSDIGSAYFVHPLVNDSVVGSVYSSLALFILFGVDWINC